MHHNLTRQIQRNEESRDYWHSFRDHRQQVMELLLASAAAQPGSICILGSGNCNDVDLARLMRVYHAVHLVDLDPLALEFALERQGLADSPIQRYGGVDLNLPALASGQTGEAPQSGVLPASIRTSTPTPWDQQSFEVVSSQFTGINPFAIRARLHEGRFGPVEPSETRLMRPWRWDHGQRQFAVAAIRYRKEQLACQTALAR